jgi:hypothetical protein
VLFSGLGKVKLNIALAVAIAMVLISVLVTLTAKAEDSRVQMLGFGVFFATVVPSILVARRRLDQGKRSVMGLLDPQATVLLTRSRLNSFLRLISSLGGLVASATFIETSEPDSPYWVIGWAMLVAFSVIAVVLLLLLSWRGFTITLSPVGINYSAFRVGPIAWADIRSAELRPYMKRDVLNLELVDSEKYFARGYPLRRMSEAMAKRAGLSAFMVSGESVGLTSREIHDAVAVRLAAFGLNQHSV